MEKVPTSILAQFSGKARQLIDAYGAEEALSAALVVMTGAERYAYRSLLTHEPVSC